MNGILLYDREALAKAIHVSLSMIDNLVKAEKIPVIKCGKRNLFNGLRVVEALESGVADPKNGGATKGMKYAA